MRSPPILPIRRRTTRCCRTEGGVARFHLRHRRGGPDGENIGSASGRDTASATAAFPAGPGGRAGRGRRSRAQPGERPLGLPDRAADQERGGRNASGPDRRHLIESFQDAIRVDHLPAGSIVRIVNERGIVVAAFPEVSRLGGRDLSKAYQRGPAFARQGEQRGRDLERRCSPASPAIRPRIARRGWWSSAFRPRSPPCRSPPSSN